MGFVVADTVMNHLLMGESFLAGAASDFEKISDGDKATICALREADQKNGARVPILWRASGNLHRHALRFTSAAIWANQTASAGFSLGASGGATSQNDFVAFTPPLGGWRNKDILREMDRAVRERTSLLEFSQWLERKIGRNLERRFLLETFWAVIDTEVLTKKRAKPRNRPTLSEIEASLKIPVEDSTLHRWTNHWVTFATRLNAAHAIRPFSADTLSYLGHFEKGKLLENLFLEASSAFQKAMRLFLLLTSNDLINEALVVANIILGIHDGPRLLVSQLGVEGLSGRGVYKLEERMEKLARKYGFPLKEKQ